MQDPQIFTKCVKPHFEYHNPPLERFDRAASGRVTLRPGPQRYAYVEPVAAFKDALNMVVALPGTAVGTAVGAAGKAVGVAGKVVGAAGMAVLHFGSTSTGHHGSQSTQPEDFKGGRTSSKGASSSRKSTSHLEPVHEPEPEPDVLKTYGVQEFVPDF